MLRDVAVLGVRKGYLLGNPSGYRRIHIRFYYLETDWETDWETNWETDWETNWETNWETDWETDWE